MSQPTQPRACTPEEVSQWIRFLDGVFGYQAPQSYGTDFAPLFEPAALVHSRLIVADHGPQGGAKEILSSAILYPRQLVTQGQRLKVGIIGAVATQAEARGQGHSGRILRALEGDAQALGLAGLFLWSDQTGFYEQKGFIRAGHQMLLYLDDLPKPASPVKGSLRPGWTESIVATLYDQHESRVERDASYWQAIAKVTSCERFEWAGPSGVKAYLGLGRGKDLPGIVHEWGGEPLALHHLSWQLAQLRPGLLWMTHPRLKDPVHDLLRKAGAPEDLSHLALFKPLVADPELPALLEHAWFWGLDSL